MDENELKHFGILGMKWGVRRTAKQLGRDTKSDDSKEASSINKKNKSQMSNSELKKVNERMRLEQEYDRLNKNTVQKGWKYVAATVGVVGTVAGLVNNGKQIINAAKTFLQSDSGKKVMSSIAEYGYKHGLN